MEKGKFQSTKVFDGFSTVFRQHNAINTHCCKLHGYAVSFKVWFEGELDHRNWVQDFSFGRNSEFGIDGMTPKQWMKFMFDHTVILAKNDPALDDSSFMSTLEQVANVRIVDTVGAEMFAKLIFEKLNEFVQLDSLNRVRVVQVEFFEHEKNSAIYTEK